MELLQRLTDLSHIFMMSLIGDPKVTQTAVGEGCKAKITLFKNERYENQKVFLFLRLD